MSNKAASCRLLYSCNLARDVRPIAIYAYFDVIQVWLERPVSERDYRWLKSQCGKRDCHRFDGTAAFDPRYQQRLQLRQPTKPAQQWIANRGDAYLNRAEYALDWVFASEAEKQQAETLFRRYFVKHHRGKQEMFYQSTTQYLASREAANNIVCYGDKNCRITGELHCLHIEWRKQGAAALLRAGITAQSLIQFDHRAFWKEKLLLYAINPGKLGREYRKRYESGYRNKRYCYRKSDRIISFGSFAYNQDREMGLRLQKLIANMMWVEKGCNQMSTQAVIDAYRGKGLKVAKALEQIDVSHLLPEEELPDLDDLMRGDEEGPVRSKENRNR